MKNNPCIIECSGDQVSLYTMRPRKTEKEENNIEDILCVFYLDINQ